jgi:lipopolysaccharide biosynthesis glycosyltransferase
MNIAYSCDNHYIEQTGISLLSLLENNSDIKDMTIYLISKGINFDNLVILSNLCKDYGRILEIIEFEKLCYDLEVNSTGRHVETIYVKFFFSRIDGLKKIIYLDSDTIICGSLSELYSTDISGCYMGLVETYTDRYRDQLNIKSGNPFFNDGVALINVDFCRENNLIERAKNALIQFNNSPPVLSEGILNMICQDNIKLIHPRYNLMSGLLQYIINDLEYLTSLMKYSKNELIEASNVPVVIHYLSGFYNRPWCVKCSHPYKDKYLYYKSISPWARTPLINKNLPLKLLFIGKIINVLGLKRFNYVKSLFNRVLLLK